MWRVKLLHQGTMASPSTSHVKFIRFTQNIEVYLGQVDLSL